MEFSNVSASKSVCEVRTPVILLTFSESIWQMLWPDAIHWRHLLESKRSCFKCMDMNSVVIEHFCDLFVDWTWYSLKKRWRHLSRFVAVFHTLSLKVGESFRFAVNSLTLWKLFKALVFSLPVNSQVKWDEAVGIHTTFHASFSVVILFLQSCLSISPKRFQTLPTLFAAIHAIGRCLLKSYFRCFDLYLNFYT